MRPVSIDLFDQRAIMDSNASNPLSSDGDFGFAFNDSNFSDRLLRIEIVEGISDIRADGDGCSNIADWASHRKRRREGIKIESVVDLISCPDEQVFNCTEIDADEGIGCEYHEEEPVPMIEESLPVEEITATNDTKMGPSPPAVMTVKTLHISSPILAAKSPFFYKLFSNGMRESEQRHVTLRINASEEVALMELINFMYSNTLSTTVAPALLDVLLVADKFEVASCMRYCSRLLRDIPMTPESALLYLDLPSSVLMAEAVQPLTDAAKQYLAARYKDITKYQEEVMGLPLAGIEAVLSSDELQVASEDTILDYVLKWARANYGRAEERREMLCTRLAHLIRFPHMSCRKLRKVLACGDLDKEFASKAVLEALFFKAEPPHRQRMLLLSGGEEGGSSFSPGGRRFAERAYKYRPLKTVEFDLPRPHCLVYLTLSRDECAALFPSGRVYSQAFHLAGQGFFLSAHCNMDQLSSFHCFGLFLGMQEKGSSTFQVDYEFSARSKPSDDYLCKYKGNYTFTGGKAVGYRNLFGLPWTSFMADDSPFFISGFVHLRAELTVKP